MKEKIKVLIAYCSDEFQKNVLPLIVPYADKWNRTELKFECAPVEAQEKWDELKDAVKSGRFTHIIIDRKLRGHMTTSQWNTLKKKVHEAKAQLKLQSPNGGLKEKEIAFQIGNFFVPDVKILSDMARGENYGSDENEDD